MPRRSLRIVALVAVVLAPLGCRKPEAPTPLDCTAGQASVVSSTRAFCLDFFQADREHDNGIEPDSPLGIAELSFQGEPDLLYFNLVVEGIARIHNLPIVSVEGDVRQSTILEFDLRVDPGTDVSELRFAADLTSEPLIASPTQTANAGVTPMEIVLLSGETDGEILLDDPPERLDGGPGGGGGGGGAQGHANANFPNQEQEKNECVPAAISNSMQFLNQKHSLGWTEAQMSIETWKEVVGWRESGTGSGWPALKAAHLESSESGVTSTTSTDIADAIQALDDDCDVEIRVKGHVAALVGIAPATHKNRYSITVAHDVTQGSSGGERLQTGIFSTRYTPEGKIHGIAGMNGKKLAAFVIECPESSEGEGNEEASD